jgi:hypothetical protein
LASLFYVAVVSVHAGVVVPFVNDTAGNAPPVIPNAAFIANATIFDLTNANMGTTIPAAGNLMAGDVPRVGGPCVGFTTGEVCGTVENAVVGLRVWETVIQNQSGAPRTFWAGFFAPGLANWYLLTLPDTDWAYFALPYVGPTEPLWAVVSGLPFPIVMTTSIVDPFSFTPIELCDSGTALGVSCGPALPAPNDNNPRFSDSDVPEPRTIFLFGLGIALLAICKLTRYPIRRF